MPPQQTTPSLRRRRGTGKGGTASRGGAAWLLRQPFCATMLLLLLIAVVLTSALLLVIVLSTSSTNNYPTSVEDANAVGHKVLSVPNLLRGHGAEQVRVQVQEMGHRMKDAAESAVNRASKHLPPSLQKLAHRGGNGNNNADAANDGAAAPHERAPPGPQGVGSPRVDPKLYDETPTRPYPYNLDPVAATYDASSDYEPAGGMRFTEYTTGGTPYLVTDQDKKDSDAQARSRRAHVKKAMEHAWGGYQKYGFGMDEVLPQSKHGSNNWGGQGITLVDSLDTLWLLDMKDEFWKARDWVRDSLKHDRVGSVSVFETTIRDLGGLLSAYDWSGDKAFLDKALDLGERLLRSFDGSSTGIPFGQVDLRTGRTSAIGWAGGNAILAEFGTLQIENRYLTKMTDRPEFARKTERVFEILREISPPSGLFPYYVRNNPKKGGGTATFANNKITFGAMADSLYEYMLKIWLQGGRTESLYREMYDKAIDSMHKELLQTSTPSGLVYIADKNGGTMDHKMDHLVCFMGGLLALGAYTDPTGLQSSRAQRDLRTAKALTYTCYQMYARMNTGISAEFVQFYEGKDFQIGRGAPHYLLRPEAVESFYVLNALTGDPVYREWSWEVFQSIEKYCKTDVAYGSLSNVQDTTGRPRDKMESFFLAETIKYLYLAQDPDTPVDILNKHVFNTEAHPTRIFPVIDEHQAKKKQQ